MTEEDGGTDVADRQQGGEMALPSLEARERIESEVRYKEQRDLGAVVEVDRAEAVAPFAVVPVMAVRARLPGADEAV